MKLSKSKQIRVRLSSAVVGSAAQVALTEEEYVAVRNTAHSYGFSERALSTFIRRCGELAAGNSESFNDVHTLLTHAASLSGLSLGAWLRICVLEACGLSLLRPQLDDLATARVEGRLRA